MTTNKWLTRIKPFFPNATINENDELIVEPKNNIYFQLENVKSNLDFDCKMLEWLSRPAHKGVSNHWQKYIRRGLNSYFRRDWAVGFIGDIYTYVGNGINRQKCVRFIKSDFNPDVLIDDKIEPYKFKVGDRVSVTGTCDHIQSQAFSGERGVIIRIEPDNPSLKYGVKFDKTFPYMHNLEGYCPDNNGYWVGEIFLTLEPEQATEILIGNRVGQAKFEWNNQDLIDNADDTSRLPIKEPPCKHCAFWRPEVFFDFGKYGERAYSEFLCCQSEKQYPDFSCFICPVRSGV